MALKLFRGCGEISTSSDALIPAVGVTRLRDPSGYVASPDLAQAVNVALSLGLPLLVTGEPGTGKTQLAYRVAAELALGDGAPLRFDTKTTSQATDLFYTFDNVQYFAASQLAATRREQMPLPRTFVRYEALGRAILESRQRQDVAAWLPEGFDVYTPGPRVVLIDEIDKAPRDFPNDLLNQIENLEFRVPELSSAVVQADSKSAPVVIITSNSEKQLPDAFLRRCIYFDIAFPGRAEIDEILARRLLGLDLQGDGFKGAVAFFFELRQLPDLRKKPSTSELLDWLRALASRKFRADKAFKDRDQLAIARECLPTLIKTADDRARVLRMISG